MAEGAIIQLSDDAITKPWTLGWRDRGLGHGDYGIMVGGKLMIGDLACGDLAEHIIDLHNRWLEDQNGS